MASKKKVVRVSLKQTVDSVIVHDMKNLAFRLSALLQNMEDSYDSPIFKQSMAEGCLRDLLLLIHMQEVLLHLALCDSRLVAHCGGQDDLDQMPVA